MKLKLKETYGEIILNSFKMIDNCSFDIEYDEKIKELFLKKIEIDTKSFEMYNKWEFTNKILAKNIEEISLYNILSDINYKCNASIKDIYLTKYQLKDSLKYKEDTKNIKILNEEINGKKFSSKIIIINVAIDKIVKNIEKNISNICNKTVNKEIKNFKSVKRKDRLILVSFISSCTIPIILGVIFFIIK